jgi:hypothetical protein
MRFSGCLQLTPKRSLGNRCRGFLVRRSQTSQKNDVCATRSYCGTGSNPCPLTDAAGARGSFSACTADPYFSCILATLNHLPPFDKALQAQQFA